MDRGQPATFRSSPAACRDFCAACGTSLTFRFLDGPDMEVTIRSFDNPELVPPKLNFGIESRLPWIADLAPGSLPDKMTSQSGAATRDVRSRQHPDRDTPPDWQPPPA